MQLKFWRLTVGACGLIFCVIEMSVLQVLQAISSFCFSRNFKSVGTRGFGAAGMQKPQTNFLRSLAFSHLRIVTRQDF